MFKREQATINHYSFKKWHKRFRRLMIQVHDYKAKTSENLTRYYLRIWNRKITERVFLKPPHSNNHDYRQNIWDKVFNKKWRGKKKLINYLRMN